MVQIVKAPDGTQHAFPDEATPEMIAGALGVKSPTNLGASFEQTPAEKATAIGGPDILPALKSLGKSAVANTLDLAHNVTTGAVRGGGSLIDEAYSRLGPEIGGSDPGTKLAGAFFNNVLPPYQPQSGAGAAVQGATAGAVGSPFGLLTAGLSAAGGAAGDTILHADPNAEGYAMAAQVGVPLLLGAPATVRGNASSMLARRTEGMTAADWLRAQDFENRGRAVGFPLAGPESTDNPALWQLGADVAASRAGGPTMGRFFNQRADQHLPDGTLVPGQARQVMTPLFDQVAPAPASTEAAATRVQGAAEGAIQQAERDRSAQTSPHYQAAAGDQVPNADVAGIVQQLDDMIARDPANLNPSLRSLRSALVLNPGRPAVPAQRVANQTPAGGTIYSFTPGQPAVPPTYATDIATLDRARKILRDRVELPPTAADAVGQTAANETGGQLGQLRDDMTRASPDFAFGRALHQDISENVVDPLARSTVGQLANRAGIPENIGIQGQINLVTNPATARPDNIRMVARTLNGQDPAAFPGLVRVYLENKFNAAADNLNSGPNRAMGVKFANSVAGNDAERANLRAMLEGVADAYGLPRDALAPGFENALTVMERSGRIPGIGSPTASRGATNAEASATLFDSGNPVGYIRRVWGDVMNQRAYRQLAEAFTAPNSVQAMRELAMTNPDSARAQVLVASMLGYRAPTLQTPGQPQ